MPKAAKAPAATSRVGEAGRSAGFSLTELLVVLALVALVGAVAAGGMRTGRQAQGTRMIAAELASALRQARAHAVSGNGPARVALDVKARHYISGVNRPAKFFPADMDIVVRTVAGEAMGDKNAAIRFNEDGTSSGGEIVLVRAGQSWAIRIEWLTGTVTVRESASLHAGG